MCGIVGYVGEEQAAPILLDGLSKLEYRGYDSAGIAVEDSSNGEVSIEVIKSKGKLANLKQMTDDGNAVKGTIGIGHTRWATHGEPSASNAHPHSSMDGSIALVHNGIIENFKSIKDKLIKKGYEFQSATDTEVVANLLQYYYSGDPLDTIIKVIHRTTGSYAFGILFKDHPGEVYAVRKDSPLVLGHSENGNYIASDVPAILKHTRDVYYVDNMVIAKLTKDGINFFNVDKEPVEVPLHHVEWDIAGAEKGGYEHFMLKEIYEQPTAVSETLMSHIVDGQIVIPEIQMSDEELRNISRIYIIACGSAYHAGLVGKYVIEGMAGIPVECEVASEFRYRNPILQDNSLVIVVSQSGETADTKVVVNMAKESGHNVLAIVNVVGSSIAREAGNVFYTSAGPEISVATTKAYSAQLIALYLIAIKLGEVRGRVDEEKRGYYINELKKLPDKIKVVLADNSRMQWLASKFFAATDVFFIGRGIDYAVALEGALKLKEISYIHAEAYAAGELKHGPIALIEDNTLVVSLATQGELYDKVVSNITEVRSRGAYACGISTYGQYSMEASSDYAVYVPKTDPYFMASLSVIPLQLLSYYASVAKGFDVDKPRNLAKSVTVE
ncbi:MAG: glutamine--fructose-6-phosphate transaminase (isomerizing) [Lachnospiraceae bacterium]|nr:glutamine--fructose-6-phosphate transaminase (isomerizing) [Lachnospiraceae bacterium]